MRTFSFIFLLCLIMQGCSSASEISPYEVVIKETKKLIDKQELDLSRKYVKILREYTTDSGEIYLLSTGDVPLLERYSFPPSIVIPYQGYFICYFDVYSKHILSKQDLLSQLKDENLSSIDIIRDSNWRYFIGVSKDGTFYSLVRIYMELQNCFQPYIYPSLRKYLFGTSYNEKPLFVLNYNSILVDEQFKPGNCLKEHIEGLNYFEVNILGTYDFSLIKQIRTPYKTEFITLNGKDTLRYTINTVYTDDFYLDALENNSSFFQHLPTENTLHYLDSLIHYHTYCVLKKNGRSERIRIAYFENDYVYEIWNKSGTILRLARNGRNDWFVDDDSYEKWNNP